jgi:hypothetical protein
MKIKPRDPDTSRFTVRYQTQALFQLWNTYLDYMKGKDVDPVSRSRFIALCLRFVKKARNYEGTCDIYEKGKKAQKTSIVDQDNKLL